MNSRDLRPGQIIKIEYGRNLPGAFLYILNTFVVLSIHDNNGYIDANCLLVASTDSRPFPKETMLSFIRDTEYYEVEVI